VDHELEPRGQFYWKLCRLRAFQNSVHIVRGATPVPAQTNAIAHHAACLDIFTVGIHGGQPVDGREYGNSSVLSIEHSISEHHNHLGTLANQRLECTIEIAGRTGIDWHKTESKRVCCRLGASS